MLRAAIEDENPVLVVESLSLYEGQGEVPSRRRRTGWAPPT